MYKNGKQKDLKNAKTSQKFAIFPFPLMQYMSKEGHFLFSNLEKGLRKWSLSWKEIGKLQIYMIILSHFFGGENKNGPLCSFIASEEKGIEN